MIFCCSEAALWSSSIGRLQYLSCHFLNQHVIFQSTDLINVYLGLVPATLVRKPNPRPELYIKLQNIIQHNKGH